MQPITRINEKKQEKILPVSAFVKDSVICYD